MSGYDRVRVPLKSLRSGSSFYLYSGWTEDAKGLKQLGKYTCSSMHPKKSYPPQYWICFLAVVFFLHFRSINESLWEDRQVTSLSLILSWNPQWSWVIISAHQINWCLHIIVLMIVATHGESWNGHVNIELMKM